MHRYLWESDKKIKGWYLGTATTESPTFF